MTVTLFILTLSILLQLIAAIMAFRLIPLTGKRAAWSLIATALTLMALRRGITLIRSLTGAITFRPDLNAELVALAISILMVVGISRIASIFHDRLRAEEALKESEIRYKSLFNNNHAVMLLIDPDNANIIDSNPAASAYYGWSRDALTKMRIDEINTLTKEEVSAEMKLALFEKRNHFIFKHRRADGTIRDVEVYSGPIRIKGKALLYSIVYDVADRKRAEEALKESEERYRTVADFAHAWEYWLDPDGEYIYVSPACERISGYRVEEFQQDPNLMEKITHPDDKHLLFDHIHNTLQGRSDACELEYRIITRDGQERWIGHACQGVYNHANEYLGRRGSNRDITDRKLGEEELKEKDRFIESIVQCSAVATFVVDAEHKVIYWNKACEDLTGIKSDDLLGTSDHWKAFYEHPHPCVADIIIDNKYNEMNTFYTIYARSVLIPDGIRAEGWYPNLGGKNRYLLFDAAPIRDDNGKILAAIETLQDITDRKLAEEQLLQALESLRKSFGTTVQVMVSAVETRDPYTAGHQRRVADLARAIAKEIGLSQDRIDGIRMAGIIHDLGKLSVPAEILSKPTRLTELEFLLVKEHAQKGYDILKDVESPWPLAEIVYQHHERMDGSGYPRHLKGDDILMEARIMAVADVVESMASHRPYRPALGIEVALEEIEKNRGALYDTDVADACLRLFREKGYQL